MEMKSSYKFPYPRLSVLPPKPRTWFTDVQTIAIRWAGVAWCQFITLAITYYARFVAYPILYPGDTGTIDLVAFIIIVELFINLFMFNFKAHENRVEFWQRHYAVASLRRVSDEEEMEDGRGEGDEERPEMNGKFCVECNRPAPIRSHHCPLCNQCVLRKDHHCFVTGACVGLGNQRYFIVYLFWASIGCALGTVLILQYINAEVAYWYPYGWITYIAPVAMYRWFMGYSTLSSVFVCLTLSFAVASCVIAFGFVSSQFYYTLSGYTMFEYHSLSIREAYDGDGDSMGERMRLVFGPYWAANFILPCVWWKQRLTPEIADNLFRVRSKQL